MRQPTLREGTQPATAVNTLVGICIEATNAQIGTNLDQVINSYLDWIERTENQLRNCFEGPEIWLALYSDIHWRIRRMGDREPRPMTLIRLEVERQCERLRVLQSEISRLQTWVDEEGGKLAVLDTNTLLHYQPPRQIKWREIIGARDIRLVLPLRVVEELDEKKYSGKDRLASRARSALKEVGHGVAGKKGKPSDDDEVTLEIVPHHEPRHRPLDADSEILATCLQLGNYQPDLTLITGDTAMRIRANAFGIDSLELPEKYMR